MVRQPLNIKRIEPLLHILVWAAMFAFPLFVFFNGRGDDLRWEWLFFHFGNIVCYCAVFYLNYLLLIPRWALDGGVKKYAAVNVAIVLVVCAGLQVWQAAISPGRQPGAPMEIKFIPSVIFFIKDIFSIVVVIAIALSLQMTKRWQKSEEARKEAEQMRIEAERGRTEAELKNLRNQLNPHFLLNTLNNIYALIEFDKEKAQEAVAELSKMLRYVLYENQQETVPLCKEAAFIKNYVALMEIRLSSNAKVETHIDVSPDSRTPVASLLFISLIENAFKHGISPVEPSFVNISLSETPEFIQGEITNSFYPKRETDKSGSGIGLEQVRKRLELLYPGRYSWTYGPDADGHIYKSNLIIYKKNGAEVCDNG